MPDVFRKLETESENKLIFGLENLNSVFYLIMIGWLCAIITLNIELILCWWNKKHNRFDVIFRIINYSNIHRIMLLCTYNNIDIEMSINAVMRK
jgi:Na+/serine symporter